ncbi:interferon alpha/beta receptor 2-like isoform X3 [Thunnus maccoyii]|uniref:interferon alpha/beta receptor 2-like isoform X3 n=1 Tax=Thunnus maccoyii TaxID=8240 RepID=UPI001C4AAA2E|nr:interferon alpha/beta receptor 2-like isoform X3 [Thunnus maccoyii]
MHDVTVQVSSSRESQAALNIFQSVHSKLPCSVSVSSDLAVFVMDLSFFLYFGLRSNTVCGTLGNGRSNGHKKEPPQNTTETSLKLDLDSYRSYYLTVQASYNQTLSPKSPKVPFSPYQDTKIDPPKVSLTGCGDCIQVNISLHKNIEEFYPLPHFTVSLKKPNEAEKVFSREGKNFTLENLQKGQEYCVKMHLKSNVNKNTESSAWTCTFTSIEEQRRVNVILGIGGVLLFLAICALMSLMLCLHYTGFLCKLETLPRALIVRHTALIPGQILSLETTFLELISVIPDTDKQNKSKNPTAPNPATKATNSGEAEEEEEDDDEEEEDEEKYKYMDRGGLSSNESSGQDSRDVSGNSTAPASVSLSAEVEEADAEFDREGLDQYEARDEGAEVSFMSEGGQTQVQGDVTGEEEEEDMKEKEEACHTSGNINLLSVTVAALAVSEEEEEEEQDMFTDFLKLSDREPLLPTDSKCTLSHTDSETESHDQTTLMQPRLEKVKESGYENRTAHASSSETEEEEEEHSGYMGRT